MTLKRLSKLFLQPKASFQGMLTRVVVGRTRTYVFGFSAWKQQLRKRFPEREFVFLPKEIGRGEFDAVHRARLLADRDSELFVWGAATPGFVLDFIREHRLKAVFADDGFVCALPPGASRQAPASLCLDRQGFHGDDAVPSELETLLARFDFGADPALLPRAERLLARMVEHGIGKYEHPHRVDIEALYGPKPERRVLVLGHLRGKADELLALAAAENPGAQLVFKPHPQSRGWGAAPRATDTECLVLDERVPLAQALHGVDQVYTVASLGGFEALWRGIRVTVLGCPFYAGWGLTDDRQAQPRRSRRLTLTELFAGAYLLYPKYFDSHSGKASSLEQVIARLVQERPAALPLPSTTADMPAAPAQERAPAARNGARSAPALALSEDDRELPAWFQPAIGPELRAALESDLPLFVYLPWIAEHGNQLVSRIDRSADYRIAALDLITGVSNWRVRHQVNRFVRENPHLYRRMVASRLVPLRRRLAGVVFTFDWSPVAHVLAKVCEELGIPRILVPHESVFLDRAKYYRDQTSQASVPLADVVLGWGGLQREIFVERGYPAERFIAVGAPKLDVYRDYQPQLTRAQFCRLFGFDPARRIVLFAAQTLDLQLDQQQAHAAQQRAIADLLDAAQARGLQLLVRLPPSNDGVLGAELAARLAEAADAAIDTAGCYLVGAPEALYHADLVGSVNSTMLLEGLLMNRPTLSMRYLEFDPLWQRLGIPGVQDAQALQCVLDTLLAPGWTPAPDALERAAQLFSCGRFDGRAGERVRDYLGRLARDPGLLTPRAPALERILNNNDERIDVVGIPSSSSALDRTQRYLLPLLKARTAVQTHMLLDSIPQLASVDVFAQWGMKESRTKANQAFAQRALGRPLVILEDGFIRSMDIGLSGEPGLSLIIDDTTAYYDATRPSRLQRLLQDGPALDAPQRERARHAIDKIVAGRVSKYNHAPNLPLTLGRPGRRKILLLDQRFGDQSVLSGRADEHSFEQMLHDALAMDDCDVIVKQHPDAIKGGKSSYYSDERIAAANGGARLHAIRFDVNPYALLAQVDETWVVTSGMGFEALMAGRAVRCYGAPFYAGWGATTDRLAFSDRSRRRSVEELFHFAYIVCSRYFHPQRQQVVQVEELVDYILEQRGW